MNGFRHGVALRHAADPAARQQREDGKEDGQPLAVHAAFDRIHRAAADHPVRVDDAVFDREHALCILRCDAEDAAEPAPEDRARAAEDDRRPDADDVAGADCGGQRDRQRTELRYVALRTGIVSDAQPDAEEDVPLDKLQVKRQEDVTSEQQDQQRRPPDEGIQRADPGVDPIHGILNNRNNISYMFIDQADPVRNQFHRERFSFRKKLKKQNIYNSTENALCQVRNE